MKVSNIQDIQRPQGPTTIQIPQAPVVFVTGVTGQDGSHMVDYILANTTASVIGGARRLSVENHTNISHLENEPRFQLVNFDLTDSHSIYKIIEYAKPDYFINFAAQSFVASSWDFARQTWECNSTAVLDCLEAIKRIRPTCRFYNAGSSEEFGNVAYEPQDEKHPEKPRSPYGASKAAARQLIKVYRESYGLYAVQGWLFNHEGTRRGEEFVTRKITKGVANIYKSIDEGKSFDPLFLGNVESRRDWSDAEDMVDAVWRMLNQEKYTVNWMPVIYEEGGNGKYSQNISKYIKDYVVGSGESHTIKEFVELAFKLVNIDGEWINNATDPTKTEFQSPKNTLVKIDPRFYRPAEVETLISDPSSIKKDLGWNPKINFKELVEKMVLYDLTKIYE